MKFRFTYNGPSAVQSTPTGTRLGFSPDTLRSPTFFTGELGHGLGFREAISALHDVVVSDLRMQPKDRTEYKAWLEQQEQLDAEFMAGERAEIAEELSLLRAELAELDRERARRWRGFSRARSAYWRWLYERDYDAWLIFDPVITVHPDELFFECFSRDESTYARLGVDYGVFKQVGDFACGTTNIDYSAKLYDEFQKIRSYKSTRFEVDPSGFTTQTQEATGFSEAYKEVKIDLPESWVRGFLQVNSAMALPAAQFTLHPMDVHNICFILRRYKEQQGPRSLRFKLTPGAPVSVVVDPWDYEIKCPRSVFEGAQAQEIRVWGRRRLHVLERLIPIAKKFTVHLLGSGMPSFYVADLGDMSFTLGLSGWTANDWSRAGQFDLMAPRAEVDTATSQRVFDALKTDWLATPDALASSLGLDRALVLGALGGWTQAGRAIFDLNKQVYRARELSRDPLPMSALRFSSPQEEAAAELVRTGKVRVGASQYDQKGTLYLHGQVRGRNKRFNPALTIDSDERLVGAECTCNFFQQNRLYKGPCEHMLALRIAWRDRRHH